MTLATILPRRLTLTVTQEQKKRAGEIATGRQRGKMFAAASTSIGTPQANYDACYYGTLAEIAVYDYLEAHGLNPQYILLARRAVTEADFTLGGTRYEIKCSPPGKGFLSISVRQHHDPRRPCDFYVLVAFDTPDCLYVCPPVPHANVSGWNWMDNRHEPYYSIARADLLGPARASPLQSEDPLSIHSFLLTLFSGYANNTDLRLEIRSAFPKWLEKTQYPDGNAPPNWQFRTGKRRWFPLTPAGIEAAARYVLDCQGRYEMYCGVLPRIRDGGKASDVCATRWLWCDVDGGETGVKGARDLLHAAQIRGLLPPTLTVVSGNGLHLYWQLDETIDLLDEDTRNRFKSLLQRLCLHIGGKTPAPHADPSRAEVASILRIPGTFNRKSETDPRPVALLPPPLTIPRMLVWWRSFLPSLPARPVPRYDTNPMSHDTPARLIRFAQKPSLEGNRHNDLVKAAAWFIRDLKLAPAIALQLLEMKAQASPGTQPITTDELRSIIKWA